MDRRNQYQPKCRLAPSVQHETLRNWSSSNTKITADSLMFPIFLINPDSANKDRVEDVATEVIQLDGEDDNGKEEISSLPGIFRYGINKLLIDLEILVKKNLKSLLLFGVITNLPKDECGTHADSPSNPVVRAVPHIKKYFPQLVIACDVCLCTYTSHGHCGILLENGKIDYDKSIARLQEVALSYANAGADIIAPSDMMDGRIGAIKQGLRESKFYHVAVLSYAAKFASTFYGPFRQAAKSAPAFGDRKCYQLPPGSSGLACRAIARDVEEGADMLMVKPGLPYLDIVTLTKQQFPQYPLFVYQVSGEYSMIYNAAKAGALTLRTAVEETMTSFRRADYNLTEGVTSGRVVGAKLTVLPSFEYAIDPALFWSCADCFLSARA